MFVLEDATVVMSPSDLTTAAACEFAFLRNLDARLGRIETPPSPDDPMLRRAGRLGDAHEERVLERYRARATGAVVEIARPDVRDPAALDAAVRETLAAFESGAEVVFQATFFDGEQLGFADFIVRQPDGAYQVQDSKLARSAKVPALLQLAAYAEHLERLGVRVDPTVVLLLGDGSVSEHALRDIAPVYRERAAHLRRLVVERVAASSAIAWGSDEATACGRCATCEPLVESARDLLLVAGLRATQRSRLVAAGITTIEELATSSGEIEGMAASTLRALRSQAALQLRASEGAPPPVEVHDVAALTSLPSPSPGDVFFDFEGDPLYAEPGEGDETRWGLDYLFGLVEADGTFRAFWAHSLAEEALALRQFLDYLAERLARFPDLHVYHYASYERTHLAMLAARHGVGEDEVDNLLRSGVLVDLYPVVRGSLRIGARSYSLKTVEKLYLPEARSGEVTTAGDSVEEYARFRALLEAGHEGEAAELLGQIADYNEADCLSTLGLRDWLLTQRDAQPATGAAAGPAAGDEEEKKEIEESQIAVGLRSRAGSPADPERSAEERAYGLAAAAVDYHRREAKSFWWGHFARLEQPFDEWAETKDVLVVRSGEVLKDWHIEGKQRSMRRILRLRGDLGPGSTIAVAATPFVLYPHDGPLPTPSDGLRRQAHQSTEVLEVSPESVVTLCERLRKDAEPYGAIPVALTPEPPPRAASLEEAIAEWGNTLLDAAPVLPADCALDVLRRVAPRTRSGRGLAPGAAGPDGSGPGAVEAITSSLRDLDSSYIAVQGPPGTGKTYTGAHVIATLVREGWKIGVVAQSHATVENMLEAVLSAGVDPGAVGKKPRDPSVALGPWRRLSDGATPAFLAEPGGRVLGGTAWVFSNVQRVPRRGLDLLVIDEAGQFSLAATIAVSVAARNLLLLGDPQQLPQVSQGVHPEPVDGSALGWISDGHDVMPPELGYFLPDSRRMSAPLAATVSELAYEGRLASHPTTADRLLAGVAPGLHPVPVEHEGSATESAREAAEVVSLVEARLGTPWTDPSAGRVRDPLTERDIIVVAPYNAQVALVRAALAAAGLGDVRVGTVDKFQGQQAVIAIVTLAASSHVDVPRGMDFLIMRNRINVAISRAQWAAYLVHSPALVDYLPRTPRGVAELSAFLRVVREE